MFQCFSLDSHLFSKNKQKPISIVRLNLVEGGYISWEAQRQAGYVKTTKGSKGQKEGKGSYKQVMGSAIRKSVVRGMLCLKTSSQRQRGYLMGAGGHFICTPGFNHSGPLPRPYDAAVKIVY